MANPTAFCKSEDFDSIDQIETTTDTLTGRAGLALFSRYLRNLGLFAALERLFGSLRKSEKGLPIPVLFHQLFCFFLDGTDFSLVRFDDLKESEGYAGAIEVDPESMASSHQIKRLFYGFSLGRIWLFRRLIQQLFLWRLRVRDPEVVILGMDSMVLDNDGAEKREGVEPTYKGVEGFHPFQITWDRFVADAVLRGGSKHSNDGDTAIKAIEHLAQKIRKALGEEIPIVVRMDAGFCDKKIYQACEGSRDRLRQQRTLAGGDQRESGKAPQIRLGPLSERVSRVGLSGAGRPTWNLEPIPTDDPHSPSLRERTAHL